MRSAALGLAIVALFTLPTAALATRTARTARTESASTAVTAVANITLSAHGVAFAAADSSQQYLPSNSIGVSGTIVTNTNGSGSIDLMSPANISGTGGGLLKISYFSMTCSGAGVPGQTFVALKAQLAASSSRSCASYSGGFSSLTAPGGQVDFTLSLFLDDRTLDADTYPATNFAVVASAT